jgi:uncharacterized delta-60 repeat protein
MVLQPDGRILIGGTFISWNGLPYQRVVRLRPDGSVDTSLNAVPISFSDVWPTIVAGQSDGKVVMGGSFTSVNATNRNRVARLNADGSLDLSFDPGTGANQTVFAVGVQSGGQVLVGGDFTKMNDVPCSHVARLNSNGSVDTNFTASVATGISPAVSFIAVLPDDKFIIGGNFTSVNGYSRNGIARLNADGTLDTTFQPGSGANGPVKTGAVQADGQVLVGGAFTTFNGIPRKNTARLLANGPWTPDSIRAPELTSQFVP